MRATWLSWDELIALCWAGRIVGEDAIQMATAKVRRVGEATGAFAIETAPKVGYRLVPADPAAPGLVKSASGHSADVAERL